MSSEGSNFFRLPFRSSTSVAPLAVRRSCCCWLSLAAAAAAAALLRPVAQYTLDCVWRRLNTSAVLLPAMLAAAALATALPGGALIVLKAFLSLWTAVKIQHADPTQDHGTTRKLSCECRH